jgi:hypothetical protein
MSSNSLLDRLNSRRGDVAFVGNPNTSESNQKTESIEVVEIDSSKNNAPIKYQDFVFFLESDISKKRIDLEITHPTWNTTRFSPFCHFDKNGNLATPNQKIQPTTMFDLVIDAKEEGLHLIEFVNKSNEITYTLHVNKIPKQRIHVSAMNWFSVDNLTSHILNIINTQEPLDMNITFKMFDFKNFLNAKINRSYSKHIVQIDPRYTILKFYLDTRFFQKLICLDFTNIQETSFDLAIHNTCEHRYNTNVQSDAHNVIHSKKSEFLEQLPFNLQSIITILEKLKLFFNRDCPRLYPLDIEEIENTIVAQYNSTPYVLDYQDRLIKKVFEKFLLLP